MRQTPRAAVVCALALVVPVTACSAEPDRERSLDLSDRASSSTSPSEPDDGGDDAPAEPSGPSGTGGALPTSYPEVGLEFASLPPASGTRRDALATYVDYERGLRQLSRSAEPNRLITDNADQGLVTTMRSTLDYLRGDDVRYRGTAVISVDFDGASGRAAVLDLCTDGSDLELVTDGTPGPVTGPERVAGRVVLTNTGGTWVVTQYDTLEESC